MLAGNPIHITKKLLVLSSFSKCPVCHQNCFSTKLQPTLFSYLVLAVALNLYKPSYFRQETDTPGTQYAFISNSA
jgi:hypothetical protein